MRQTGDQSACNPESWAQARLKKSEPIANDDLLTLISLLPHKGIQRGPREVQQSFVAGCYAQGGFRGLRHECSTFPFACRIMTRYIRERLPGHVFSTCGIFIDSFTPLHKDTRNAQWPNAIFRLSDFKNGGLWIEGSGDDVRELNGQELTGQVHEIGVNPLLFDAWSRYHETEPWTGSRVILVTWVVQQLESLNPDQISLANELGFQLPPSVPQPLQTSQLGARQPVVFEVFAGKGSLSRALRHTGFQVHSFDHHHCDSTVPLLQVDLSSTSGQALFWDFFQNHKPFAVHLGAPCGTSSKARGRPLRNGAPGPKPLRSKPFPLGLPSIVPGSVDALRLEAANQLYALTYRILRKCVDDGVVVSLENPVNSYLWDMSYKPMSQLIPSFMSFQSSRV